ncbi:hypothetical protein HD554DRAFT_2040565 [Boletus coccyginus]|nr:hypothetical protein HD554DRAFT_2040565 [Boletus coccyginus]
MLTGTITHWQCILQTCFMLWLPSICTFNALWVFTAEDEPVVKRQHPISNMVTRVQVSINFLAFQQAETAHSLLTVNLMSTLLIHHIILKLERTLDEEAKEQETWTERCMFFIMVGAVLQGYCTILGHTIIVNPSKEKKPDLEKDFVKIGIKFRDLAYLLPSKNGHQLKMNMFNFKLVLGFSDLVDDFEMMNIISWAVVAFLCLTCCTTNG